MLKLDVELAVCQDDLPGALMSALCINYAEAEQLMCEIGFYQGNGDVTFSRQWPLEDEEANAASDAIQAWLVENNYDSVRFYEDH